MTPKACWLKRRSRRVPHSDEGNQRRSAAKKIGPSVNRGPLGVKVKTFRGEQLIRWNGRKPSRASAVGLMAKSCAMRKHVLCNAAMQERRGSLSTPKICAWNVCAARSADEGDPDARAPPAGAETIIARSAVSISNMRISASAGSYRYSTMPMRTGADYEIELPMTVTPLGTVSSPRGRSRRFRGSACASVLPIRTLEAVKDAIDFDLSRCVGCSLPTPLQQRPVSQPAYELHRAEPEDMHP